MLKLDQKWREKYTGATQEIFRLRERLKKSEEEFHLFSKDAKKDSKKEPF